MLQLPRFRDFLIILRRGREGVGAYRYSLSPAAVNLLPHGGVMAVIQVTRERTNAFRLYRHGLWPRRIDLMDALTGTGFLPTREAAYLALAVRVEGF